MRHFKLIRPTTGYFYRAAAMDLAGHLAQMNVSKPKHISLALCGGKTVGGLLSLLIEELMQRDATVFPKLQVFETDSFEPSPERPEPNWKIIMDRFGDYVVTHDLMTLDQFHRCPLTADRTDDLRVYSQRLRDYGGGRFDVAVLSIGGGTFTPGGEEDPGHVAGIFPGRKEVWGDTSDFIPILNSPKPPAVRVTSSPHLLGKSRLLFGLLVGEERRNALDRLHETRDPIRVPSHLFYASGTGESLVYTDIVTP